MQPGGVNHGAAVELHRIGAADLQADGVILHRARRDRRMEGDGPAGRLQIALVGEHEGMAVHDAGLRRVQGGVDAQRRLHSAHGIAGQQGQVNAVGCGLRPDRLQAERFRRLAGDDQLADLLYRHAVGRAVLIQRDPPGDAEPGLEAAGGIVDTGMHDLAVARGGDGADPTGRFQHQDVAPGAGQRPGHGEADHAGTQNH